MLDGRLRASVERGLEPVGRGLGKAGISADGLTIIGLGFAVATAFAVATGHLLWGVLGLSTQDTAYQQEAVTRLHLPFAILSDAALAFAKALNLPTFTTSGMTLLKRMALVIDDGVITKVFYPVFPPDKNAGDVIAWLQESK